MIIFSYNFEIRYKGLETYLLSRIYKDYSKESRYDDPIYDKNSDN